MQAPIPWKKVAPSQKEGDSKNNYNNAVAVGATQGRLPLQRRRCLPARRRVRITRIIMRQLPEEKVHLMPPSNVVVVRNGEKVLVPVSSADSEAGDCTSAQISPMPLQKQRTLPLLLD